MDPLKNKKLLGINSLGRIGKLMVWNQIHLRHFDGIVLNFGREVGKKLDDLIQIIENDSNYGNIHKFLHGTVGRKAEIKILDADIPIIEIDGMPIKVLRKARNPKDINWLNEGVKIVVDCTGKFLDPTLTSADGDACIRGHLESGALKVVASAPFKIKSGAPTPEDATTMIYGINHLDYDPKKHHIISAASCTTTGLAHMIKPLLDNEVTAKMMTASMSTIHAATNTQSILDNVPKSGASDLRKSRSLFNNIILSTTGATKALALVLPEVKDIGFMADSVRIPTGTVSLITLDVTFHTELNDKGEPVLTKELINDIYKKAAEGAQKDLLVYSERQNVSTDMIGSLASATIEAHNTETRTGMVEVPAAQLKAAGLPADKPIQIPVTHAKIFGWYDNEMGSYVYSLSKLVNYIESHS